MANDYFSDFERLIKGQKARADSVNALLDQVEVGFDKLPTENENNRETRNYRANTGSADAYAAAITHVVTAYATGQKVRILIDAADVNLTITPTLNVSGIGNNLITYADESSVAIGDMIGMCEFVHSGSGWHFISNSLGSAAAAAASASAASTSEGNAASSASAAAASASNASTSETNSANNNTYAAEWANKAEDSLISAAAGGDEVDDYSAKHFANKAAAALVTATKILDSDNSQIDVTNTVTETTIYTHTIPANTVAANGTLRFTLTGEYQNNSGGADTIGLGIALGASTIVAVSDLLDNTSLGTSTFKRTFTLDVVIPIITTSSEVATGHVFISEPRALNLFRGVGIAAPGAELWVRDSAIAEDMTTDTVLAISVKHTTAHANISFNKLSAVLEYLPG